VSDPMRRAKLLALTAAELVLDGLRWRVQRAIVRTLLDDVRATAEVCEREVAEMRAARVPPEGWN